MTVLDNPRHELFAQALARGTPQNEAYVDAGFRSESPEAIGANASRLAADADVQARVKELLQRAAYRAELKALDIQEMLLHDRTLARELGQPSAAIRAAELLGKQIGMFVDRKEIKTNALDNLSPAQLDAIILVTGSLEGPDPGSAPGSSDGGRAGEAHPEDPDVLPG